MLSFYALGLQQYFTFDYLKEKHLEMKNLISNNIYSSAVIFLIVYVVAIALSLPIAGILSLFIGFVFPFPFSTMIVVFGATMGACILFYAAKTAFSEFFYEKVKPFLSRIKPEIEENGKLYLITLRLIPLIPFWLLNLAPAFLNIPVWTFAWTTFIGIIPGSLIYTYAGNSLNTIFAKNEEFSIKSVFSTEILIALILIILFSLIPLIYKKWRKKNDR